MSHQTAYIGPRAFNHAQGQSPNVEAEYERLRNAAHYEAHLRGQCFDRSRRAYDEGDGRAAKELSEQGKEHGRRMEELNAQASAYIFRENNADGRVAADTIDLHGQYTNEAEDILEQRIRYAQQTGQTHLHVIVGKGIHSANHVQVLKPRVEQLCRELGLQYSVEPNEGRIYLNLTGGPALAGAPPHGHHAAPYQQPQPVYQQQQQQQQQDQMEELVEEAVPLLDKLCKCCTVM